MIPQDFVTDLLSRVDIVSVIGGAVPLKKAGKDFKARCPFHQEKTPSFVVSQSKQFYHCFGCGAHGTAIGFLMDYRGLPFVEAVEELAAHAGVEVPKQARSSGGHDVDHGALFELTERSTRYFADQLRQSPEAIQYLKQRGITGDTAKKFEIGYAPSGWDNLLKTLGTSEQERQHLLQIGIIVKKDSGGYYDRFRQRIIFPIRDLRGRTVGFGGRAIGATDDQTPKYLNSPETIIFHKGTELYGLHQILKARQSLTHIYLVEGYMDVISLAQHGIHNTVAALGTAVTKNHLEKLYRQCKELVFCFDGDAAGQKAAWRTMEIALPLLKEGRQIYFMFMPENDDPDTFVTKHGRDEFENTVHRIPLSDYLLNHFTAGQTSVNRETAGQIIDRITPLIGKLPIGGLRELIIKDVAEFSSISVARLNDLILHGQKRQSTQPINRSVPTHHVDTLLGDAISLLIQNPKIGMDFDPEKLDDIAVTDKGVQFLRELLVFIQSKADITCGQILEHWSDSRYAKRLNELSIKDILRDELEDEKNLFLEIVEKIRSGHEKRQREKHCENITSIEELRHLRSTSISTTK